VTSNPDDAEGAATGFDDADNDDDRRVQQLKETENSRSKMQTIFLANQRLQTPKMLLMLLLFLTMIMIMMATAGSSRWRRRTIEQRIK